MIIRIMTKYNNSGDKDSDRNRVYLYFDNDVENDEVNSKDDGIECCIYWCDSEASEYNLRLC